jgi:hypothetical protein
MRLRLKTARAFRKSGPGPCVDLENDVQPSPFHLFEEQWLDLFEIVFD